MKRREVSRLFVRGRRHREAMSTSFASPRFWSPLNRMRPLQATIRPQCHCNERYWNSRRDRKADATRNSIVNRASSAFASYNDANHDDPNDPGKGKQDDPLEHRSWLRRTSAFLPYSISISKDGQAVNITMPEAEVDPKVSSNGTTTASTFSAPLLWVNDPQYIHPSSGQRLRSLGSYSLNDCAIVGAEVVNRNLRESSTNETTENGFHPAPVGGSMHPRGGIYSRNFTKERSDDLERRLLKLKWKSGEESFYDLEWLIDQSLWGRMGWSTTAATTSAVDDESRNDIEIELSSLTRVTKDIAIGAIGNPNTRSIPSFDYRDVMVHQNGTTLLEAMKGIFEHGAILIQGAPFSDRRNELIVGDLGKLFSGGRLSHGTLYGDVFHVETKCHAENIAYTDAALPPHQDLTYYESKPFLQLLHCVNDEGSDGDSRIIGGESVLIDAMAAAEELRILAPSLFNILCNYEATFLKEREGAGMVSPKPHIVTDPTFDQVVGINWSPPFEGPLQLNPQISPEDYVRAYQAMECIVDYQQRPPMSQAPSCKSSLLPPSLERALKEYARTFTWEFTLQQGDVLVFNNQRMLHGRRGFTSLGSSRRHLIGCYTDAMETTSHYRQLLREKNDSVSSAGGGFGRRNAGNGCRWM